MPMIKVNEAMLEALLEMFLKRYGCFAIEKALNEKMPCHMEGCAEEICPFYNAENLVKYLTGKWDEEHDYD